MNLATTTLLFFATAIAEIIGRYLLLLWLKGRTPLWALAPATFSFTLFVWLLTLHPIAAGRVYAAYGGIYVVTTLGWLWLVEGIRPTMWNILSASVAILGMAIILLVPRGTP